MKAIAFTLLPLLFVTTVSSQTQFSLQKRAPAKSFERYGDLPLGAVIRTDERYSKDPLIKKPRGWHYWNRLENAKPFQNPSLWGDKQPTGHYSSKAEFETDGTELGKNDQAKLVTVENCRDMRYGEILIVKRDSVEVYNTTGLNDCPKEHWDAMDLQQLANDLSAKRVQKNGPKFWMMDSQSIMLGKTAKFGEVDARWAAKLPVEALGKEGAAPYRIFTSKRTQKMVYKKGRPVFELVDPDGNAYVMQAHGAMFTMKSLSSLGDRMKKLPQHWRFRTRILNDDLILNLKPDKTIHMVGDEFHQYYTRIRDGK